MKILHITNSLSEGGVESFLLNLLPRLREKGYAVELLVLNRNSVSMKKVFEDNGIKVNIGKYRYVRVTGWSDREAYRVEANVTYIE